MHALHEALAAAAEGRFPPVDGVVEVHRAMHGGRWAVVEFTGHAFVVTDHEPAEVLAQGVDAFGGVTSPNFLRWLAGPAGSIGSHDAVLVARGRGGGSLPDRADLGAHPRVERARHHRHDVRVHGDAAGFVTLGHGLVGRLELSVELLASTTPGAGEGRRLIGEGLGLVPSGELVWAQVAPGNAASLRAFLACGFAPVGAEVLIEPAR